MFFSSSFLLDTPAAGHSGGGGAISRVGHPHGCDCAAAAVGLTMLLGNPAGNTPSSVNDLLDRNMSYPADSTTTTLCMVDCVGEVFITMLHSVSPSVFSSKFWSAKPITVLLLSSLVLSCS